MSRSILRRLALALGVAAVLGVLLSATLWAIRIGGMYDAQAQAETFYELPDDLPAGEPGELIAVEPLGGAPIGAQAWRIIYHSTDERGADVPVSGIVIAPTGPAPEGGRPVIAWAHPTTGAVGDCAPSRGFDPYQLVEGIHSLLGKGYVIAATDYVGMGLDLPSSYLIGATAGRSVLDSVRAAQAIEGADAGDRVVLWGHSQGGAAALFAEQLADDYAPELDVAGVAVAAPAADLATLLSDDIDDLSGVSIGSYAFSAYADYYGVDIDEILTPAAQAVVPEMAKTCLTDPKLHELGRPLVGDFVSEDPWEVEPWKELLARNSPDAAGGGRPLFIAQGLADQLVDPSATADFVTAACASGRSVRSLTMAGVDHGFIAELSVGALGRWLDELERGTPATTGC